MDAQGHVLSVLRNVGTSKATGKQLAEWGVAFSYPKPIRLIEYLVQIFTPPGSNDLVMDFFAGSGTTAHAVMRANMRDDGHRNFILVQISERRSEENLCALTRRGVASAGAYLSEQPHTTTHDFGFRSMRLASSNVKHWHLESDSSQGSV